MPIPYPPAWVLPGAKYDIDFANNRYWGGYVSMSSPSSNIYGNLIIGEGVGYYNGSAYVPDGNGILRPFSSFNSPRITSGMGLWAESQRNVSSLYNRDLTNAVWTKTNGTAAKNQTGGDGVANSASSFTATAANAVVSQSITLASNTFIATAYIKPLTVTGAVSMTIDGTTYTDVTAQLSGPLSALTSNGFIQVAIPAQTLANPVIGIKLANSGDSIGVDFVCCQNTPNPTFPLSTTNATATCAGQEEPVINDFGSNKNDGQRLFNTILNGAPYAFRSVYSGRPFLTRTGWVLSSDNNINSGAGYNGNGATFNGATTSNSATSGIGNLNRLVGSTGFGGTRLCLNGGPITVSASNPGSVLPTHSGIGNNGADNGNFCLNGFTARLTFWDKELTDGQMIEWTR